MGERAPYSRVYWSIVDDPKFVRVFDDDHHLATWLRLLIAADAIWPASPSLPVSARKVSVKVLVDVGLVDLQPGHHRYRIHGLDNERGRRKDAATTRGPSGTQTDPEPKPGGTPARPSRTRDASPERARDAILVSSRLGSSLDVEGGVGGDDDPAVALGDRTGSFPRGKLLEWVNDLGAKHGENRLALLIRSTPMAGNVRDYLDGIADRLRREDHAAEKREAEDERRRNAEKRAPLPESPVTLELRDMLRKKEAAERAASA